MGRRIEWIGAKSPKDDDMIQFRLTNGLYTEQQARLIRMADGLIKPMIRSYGTTKRVKRPGNAAGYSKTYEWGPRQFVVVMEDIDADRMFAKDPNEYEFRDLDNPAHDGRKPIVPWPYITKNLWKLMEESRNGPQLVKVSGNSASNVMQLGRLLEDLTDEREEKRERREWESSHGRR